MARTTEQDSSELIIRHEKLDLRIYLSSLSKLLLHEETIPERVAELKREFFHDQIVKVPIVVDASTCVVLDGMHRVAALRELNCACVPVCAVDYQNPSIRVGAWYRTMSGESSPDQVKSTLSASRLMLDAFSFDMTRFMENPMLAVLFANGECYRLMSSSSQTFDTLRITEQCIRDLGFVIKFETEHHAFQALINKGTGAIMTLPKIDKASIREAGLTGQLLPHKVTRHIVPARPLGVNVPIKTLTDQTVKIAEANRRFVADLETRTITREPSGAIIDGRRYDEETFIFN